MEVLVQELIRGLVEKFEIVLVSRDRSGQEIGSALAALISGHIFWDSTTRTSRAARQLSDALVAIGVKLAHFHGGTYDWHCSRAARSPLYYLPRAGVACLMTNHMIPPLLEGFSKPGRPAWLCALLLPRAWLSKASLLRRIQAEVMVSKHDQSQMRRRYRPFSGKILQMYHSRIVQGEPPAFQSRQKNILCLGTLCERKGQIVLTRAFASIAERHPDWTLQIMGRTDSPRYLENLKSSIAKAGFGERIQLLAPEEDPRPALKAAAVFAMPSLIEPLGLSLQEALYYQCACVGSSVGGIPELIEHEATGLLVSPGDDDALAAALDRLMADETLRARLGRAGRQSILDKGMSAEAMIQSHFRIYDAVLAGKNLAEILP
jgi:glycosyltransferase involved in cell wall biosynthesis